MKKKMNIGYFGDGVWAYKNLLKIIKDSSINLKFICLRYKKPDKKIKKISRKINIPCFNFKNINSNKSLKKILKFECDYLISMSYDQIFGKAILNRMKNKIINCHAGMLPFYRGRNIINWAIVNGEKYLGITTHIVSSKIDQGNIIDQIKLKIYPKDTYSSLLKKAEDKCASLLFLTIKKIQRGKFKTIPQNKIDRKGSYFKKRTQDDEKIYWSDSAKKIHNLIRAISHPGPNSKTYLNNKLLRIKKSSLLKSKKILNKSKVGEITSSQKKYFIVNTGKGLIKILNWYPKINIKKGHIFL